MLFTVHTVNITNPKSQGIFSQKPPTHGNVNKIHPPSTRNRGCTTRRRDQYHPPLALRPGAPLPLRPDPGRRGLGEVGRLALQRKRTLAPLHRASNGLPERFPVEAQLSLGGFLPVCIQTRCRRNRTFFVHAAGRHGHSHWTSARTRFTNLIRLDRRLMKLWL